MWIRKNDWSISGSMPRRSHHLRSCIPAWGPFTAATREPLYLRSVGPLEVRCVCVGWVKIRFTSCQMMWTTIHIYTPVFTSMGADGPSGPATLRQRRINVDATSRRCIDVASTLMRRCINVMSLLGSYILHRRVKVIPIIYYIISYSLRHK